MHKQPYLGRIALCIRKKTLKVAKLGHFTVLTTGIISISISKDARL